jgi:hypothetical protein
MTRRFGGSDKIGTGCPALCLRSYLPDRSSLNMGSLPPLEYLSQEQVDSVS